jgi:spermidine synthase
MRKPNFSLDHRVDSDDSLLQRTPFLHRRPETLSLHFDFGATQSEMRFDAPEELVLGYTRTIMGFLLFQPKPRKIVMIGLGGGSLPKYCYAKLPDTAIAVAEINAEVIACRDEFRVPPDNERFRVVRQDGAGFIRDTLRHYDVLILDGYDAAGPAPQLCTQNFYDECYRKLTPGGVMVVNLAFFAYVSHKKSIDRIRRSFADAVVVVESEDPGNRIAFARKGKGMGLADQELNAHPEQFERHHTVDLSRTLRCIRDELARCRRRRRRKND